MAAKLNCQCINWFESHVVVFTVSFQCFLFDWIEFDEWIPLYDLAINLLCGGSGALCYHLITHCKGTAVPGGCETSAMGRIV